MKRVVMEKGCSAGSLVNSYIGSHTQGMTGGKIRIGAHRVRLLYD